jgi:hypothetical protein
MSLERSKIIKENADNFEKFIYSTKTKHNLLNLIEYETSNKSKIRGYGWGFNKEREMVWTANFSIDPSKLDLPKEYLGIPIQYAQVIKSYFL